MKPELPRRFPHVIPDMELDRCGVGRKDSICPCQPDCFQHCLTQYKHEAGWRSLRCLSPRARQNWPQGFFQGQDAVPDRHAGPQEMQFVHHLVPGEVLPDHLAEFIQPLRGNMEFSSHLFVDLGRGYRDSDSLASNKNIDRDIEDVILYLVADDKDISKPPLSPARLATNRRSAHASLRPRSYGDQIAVQAAMELENRNSKGEPRPSRASTGGIPCRVSRQQSQTNPTDLRLLLSIR